VAPGLQEAAAVRFDEIFAKRTKNQASEMVSYPLAKTKKTSVSESQKDHF